MIVKHMLTVLGRLTVSRRPAASSCRCRERQCYRHHRPAGDAPGDHRLCRRDAEQSVLTIITHWSGSMILLQFTYVRGNDQVLREVEKTTTVCSHHSLA